MKLHYGLFGSWKLRHGEPIEPGDDVVYAIPLKRLPDAGNQVVVLNLGKALNLHRGVKLTASDDNPFEDASSVRSIPSHCIPLGLLSKKGATCRLTHIILRFDLSQAQFLKIPPPFVPARAQPMWRQIYTTFEYGHGCFSNHESYYNRYENSVELVKRFQFITLKSFFYVGRELYEKINSGGFTGFLVKYGDSLKLWSYDNRCYRVLPNPQCESGLIMVMDFSREKNNWDDHVSMIHESIASDMYAEQRIAFYPNQWLAGEEQMVLENRFGYPLEQLPAWRRNGCEVIAESTDSGNIFSIQLDHCCDYENEDLSRNGRLMQCCLAYEKTCGYPQKIQIQEDLEILNRHLREFLKTMGTEPRTDFGIDFAWPHGGIVQSREEVFSGAF